MGLSRYDDHVDGSELPSFRHVSGSSGLTRNTQRAVETGSGAPSHDRILKSDHRREIDAAAAAAMKIDVLMMSHVPEDLSLAGSSKYSGLVEEEKDDQEEELTLEMRTKREDGNGRLRCRLEDQISAESFQLDLTQTMQAKPERTDSSESWTHPSDPPITTTSFCNPHHGEAEMVNCRPFMKRPQSACSPEVDGQRDGTWLRIAGDIEQPHKGMNSFESDASDCSAEGDSRLIPGTRRGSPGESISPRVPEVEDFSGGLSRAGFYGGALVSSAMEVDLASVLPISHGSGPDPFEVLTSKKPGMSPRHRLLYRYQLEEKMKQDLQLTAITTRPSGDGSADSIKNICDRQMTSPQPADPPMDACLDESSSDSYEDLHPASPDSWMTSKTGQDSSQDLTTNQDTAAFPFVCHFCSYVAQSKDDFDSHKRAYHFTFKCHLCTYSSRSPGRLNRHMLDYHSEPGDAPANKKPKNPRKYTCKQCHFFTYVQEEIWGHTRVHVPESKLLSCPRCPFVCAFKHHMQYHMNNHFGYKPFKCTECNYRCNNKSMLNSHRKSHSNDYPFRCGTCNYAAKYRHALNLHLKKKKHAAAGEMLLDGGQKPARTRNRVALAARNHRDKPAPEMSWLESRLTSVAEPVAIKVEPDRMMGVSVSAPYPSQIQQQKLSYSMAGTKSQPPLIPVSEIYGHHQLTSSFPVPVSSSPFATAAFPVRCSVPSLDAEDGILSSSSVRSIPFSQPDASSLGHSIVHETSVRPRIFPTCMQDGPARTRHQGMVPLYEALEQESADLHLPRQSFSIHLTETGESADEWPLDLTSKSAEDKVKDVHVFTRSRQSSSESPNLDWYECQHCGIIFPDRILYSMHMGYHSSSDPFQCNLCGERTRDRRDFFSHISMVAHD